MEETLQTEPKPLESPLVMPVKPSRMPKIQLKYVVFFVIVALAAAGVYRFRSLVVAATVNGTPISRLKVLQESEKRAGKTTLDFLVTKKIIEDEARAKKITVSDQEIADEIKKIETSMTAQGQTLEAALKTQGMTQADLKNDITLNKELEKLVGNTVTVSDADVGAFMKDNGIKLGTGADADTQKAQIKDQVRQQKLSQAAQDLVTSLKAKAKVTYYVTY